MCPRSHDKGPEAEESVELQEGECLRGPRGLRPAPGLQAGDAGRPRAPAERAPCPAAPTGGDGPGAEEQTAVAIASVQQAAFGDHNIQYQFRTESNGGQVRRPWAGSPEGQRRGELREGRRVRRDRERLRPVPHSGPSVGLVALPPPAGDIPRSPGD